MKYPRIVEAVFNSPWAIMPDKMEAIVEFIETKASGHDVAVKPDTAKHETRAASGNVMMIPVHGVISHRIHMVDDLSGAGGTSTERLGNQIDMAVNDPSIKTIILDIDSPGGSVAGVQEVADKIFHAREKKPIVAVANSLAASAAYWIGSSATEFVVTPSGMVGSIGVLSAHTDVSKFQENVGFKTTLISAGRYKVEGNQFEPLADGARDTIQGVIDEYYNTFVSTVARNRGVKTNEVRNGFGEGRAITAKAALAENMVDKIATMQDTINRVSRRSPSRRMNAEIDLLEIS